MVAISTSLLVTQLPVPFCSDMKMAVPRNGWRVQNGNSLFFFKPGNWELRGTEKNILETVIIFAPSPTIKDAIRVYCSARRYFLQNYEMFFFFLLLPRYPCSAKTLPRESVHFFVAGTIHPLFSAIEPSDIEVNSAFIFFREAATMGAIRRSVSSCMA